MTSAPIDAQITFIYTANRAATQEFYEERLALPLACDQGDCRIYRLRPGAYLGVCHREAEDLQAPDPQRRGVIITWVTADVDGWVARLERRGVRFESAPRHSARFGIYHAFFRDPNGYLLEIQRFDDPAWDRA